jgi:cyanate permease
MSRDRDAAGRYLLLLLGGGSYFCLMFVWFSLPAHLSPVIDDLGLTSTQAGVLTGAVPLTYIPLGLASGVLIDRVGPRRGIGAAVALFGAGHVLRAGATGFWTMLLWTLLVGVGATGITFGLPKLVADLFPAERVGTASSVYLLGSYLGTATAFGVGRPVLGPLLGGWRALFLASGVVALGYAVLWGAVAAWTARRGVATPAAGASADGDGQSLRADLTAVVTNRSIALLVIVGTMYLFVTHGLQGWVVTIFESRGASTAVAGAVASVFVGAQIGGTLVVPSLAERRERRREGVVACGVTCTLGAVGLLTLDAGGWLAAAPLVLVGIGVGGLAPLIRALPVELDGIGPRLTATAVGLVFTVGEVGGFLGPALVGAIRDATGSFAGGVALFAACGAVVAAAGFALDL